MWQKLIGLLLILALTACESMMENPVTGVPAFIAAGGVMILAKHLTTPDPVQQQQTTKQMEAYLKNAKLGMTTHDYPALWACLAQCDFAGNYLNRAEEGRNLRYAVAQWLANDQIADKHPARQLEIRIALFWPPTPGKLALDTQQVDLAWELAEQLQDRSHYSDRDVQLAAGDVGRAATAKAYLKLKSLPMLEQISAIEGCIGDTLIPAAYQYQTTYRRDICESVYEKRYDKPVPKALAERWFADQMKRDKQ